MSTYALTLFRKQYTLDQDSKGEEKGEEGQNSVHLEVDFWDTAGQERFKFGFFLSLSLSHLVCH